MDEVSRGLFETLGRGNATLEEVRAYIDAGADVNAKNKYNIEALEAKYPFGYPYNWRVSEGWTALMTAVSWCDDSEVIKILLEAGANVNAYYEDSTEDCMDYIETIISLAVRVGCSSEIIKLLIKAGANVGEQCYYEYNYSEYWMHDATLLMLATRHCNSEVIRVLVNAGIDIEAEDNFGETALIWAVRHETDEQTYPDADNVKALLDLGANIEAKNNYGETALMIATDNNDIEILNLLIEAGANPNAEDIFGCTALMKAAHNGNIEILSALIEAGANVNARDKQDKSALIHARDDKIIEAILSAGFRADFVNRSGETVLMTACCYGNIAVVKALLETIARIYLNSKDDSGNTALMYAAGYNSDPEIIKALIRAGAYVNAKDSRLGKTILMEAAMKAKDPEIVKILIRAGADLTAKDKIGSSVTDYAELNPNPEILRLLENLHGAKEE